MLYERKHQPPVLQATFVRRLALLFTPLLHRLLQHFHWDDKA